MIYRPAVTFIYPGCFDTKASSSGITSALNGIVKTSELHLNTHEVFKINLQDLYTDSH